MTWLCHFWCSLCIYVWSTRMLTNTMICTVFHKTLDPLAVFAITVLIYVISKVFMNVIIIIIITKTMFMVLSSWLRVIVRVHSVRVMNAEQCQMAAEPWTKLMDLSHRPACRLLGNCIHHCHLLLLSPKANTHFIIPQKVEDWVNLDAWLHTQIMVYLRASSHPSK